MPFFQEDALMVTAMSMNGTTLGLDQFFQEVKLSHTQIQILQVILMMLLLSKSIKITMTQLSREQENKLL